MTSNAQVLPSENVDLHYSLAGKLHLTLFPILVYVSGAYMANYVSHSLSLTGPLPIEQLAFGLASICLRIGGIIMFPLGMIAAFFGKPNQSTPKWMIKRG